MSRLLASRTVGSSSATKVGWILHGLLGNGRNWNSFATHLVNRLGSHYRFILLDLRHHGNSIQTTVPPPDTIDACVDDILYFSQETNIWPTTMIGHSFGGKVLMRLVQRQNEIERYVTMNNTTNSSAYYGIIPTKAAGGESEHPDENNNLKHHTKTNNVNVFVLDSMPGTQSDQFGTSNHNAPQSFPDQLHPPPSSSSFSIASNFVDRHPRDAISKVLEIIHTMPKPLPSRKIIRETFITAGMPDKLATWMASNVIMEASLSTDSSIPLPHRHPAYRWAFNPEGVSNLYNSHMQTDTWNVLTDGPVNPLVHIHLLKAKRSHRWNEPETVEKIERIQRNGPKPNVCLYNVEGGHWLHVDNPKGVMDIICEQEGKTN
jgi:pimeloyl-ACP methyl ester carboxylesterase